MQLVYSSSRMHLIHLTSHLLDLPTSVVPTRILAKALALAYFCLSQALSFHNSINSLRSEAPNPLEPSLTYNISSSTLSDISAKAPVIKNWVLARQRFQASYHPNPNSREMRLLSLAAGFICVYPDWRRTTSNAFLRVQSTSSRRHVEENIRIYSGCHHELETPIRRIQSLVLTLAGHSHGCA